MRTLIGTTHARHQRSAGRRINAHFGFFIIIGEAHFLGRAQKIGRICKGVLIAICLNYALSWWITKFSVGPTDKQTQRLP
jgi:hypothetical protein